MPMNHRLLRPRQTGFDPRSIAGLALWLDAADSSTITISTGVSVWADKSGNGRNATQATGGKQPINSNTINGKKVVTFQGTDDTMQIGANAAFNATSQTIIVVARQASSANEALWYKNDSNAGNGVIMRYRTDRFWFLQSNSGTTEILASGANTAISMGLYSLCVLSAVIQPTAQQGWANGTLFATASATAAYDKNSAVWIGSRRDVGEYMNGDIAEVLHYSRALSASERRLAERALGRKWGITVA